MSSIIFFLRNYEKYPIADEIVNHNELKAVCYYLNIQIAYLQTAIIAAVKVHNIMDIFLLVNLRQNIDNCGRSQIIYENIV
jgi:hypothetical protein